MSGKIPDEWYTLWAKRMRAEAVYDRRANRVEAVYKSETSTDRGLKTAVINAKVTFVELANANARWIRFLEKNGKPK